MAGTPEKLIERATDPLIAEDDFIDKLLMSFRSFTKPIDFFDSLIARFNAELPENPSDEDVQTYYDMIIPVKKR